MLSAFWSSWQGAKCRHPPERPACGFLAACSTSASLPSDPFGKAVDKTGGPRAALTLKRDNESDSSRVVELSLGASYHDKLSMPIRSPHLFYERISPTLQLRGLGYKIRISLWSYS